MLANDISPTRAPSSYTSRRQARVCISRAGISSRATSCAGPTARSRSENHWRVSSSIRRSPSCSSKVYSGIPETSPWRGRPTFPSGPLGQGYVDRADQAVRPEFAADLRAGNGGIDECAAKPLCRGRAHGGPAHLLPLKLHKVILVPFTRRPMGQHLTGGVGEGPVLDGVAGQLVQNEPKRRRDIGRQQDRRAVDAHPVGIFGGDRAELLTCKLAQVRPLPFRLHPAGVWAPASAESRPSKRAINCSRGTSLRKV